jgi:hypothetical protein
VFNNAYIIFAIPLKKKNRVTKYTRRNPWLLRENDQVMEWALMAVEQNPEKFSKIFLKC